MKKMIFTDIYNLNELKSYFPVFAEDNYNVSVCKYGYLHDVGVEVVLSPIKNGATATGWDNFEQNYNNCINDIRECWRINNEYGYH